MCCISRFLTQFSMQPLILGLAQGSIAARWTLKSSKTMLFALSLLNAFHYKVRLNRHASQSMSKTLQGSKTETKSYWEERNWKITFPFLGKGSFLGKIAIQANQWFITAMASLILYCLWLPWANFLECMTYFLAGFEGSMEKGAWLQIGRGKTSRTDRRENDDQITNQSRGPTIMGVLPWQGD